jgi:hypothetical protein
MTLEEAKAWVEANRDEGVNCPCCGQLCKNYKRPLNAPMARSLIWLVRRSLPKAEGWVDLRTEAPLFVQQSRELAKLAHWELIEEKAVESARGARTSGIWRPTERGVRFAKGEIALASHVVLYDNNILEFSEKPTTIRDSLGKRFSFDELWGSSPYDNLDD